MTPNLELFDGRYDADVLDALRDLPDEELAALPEDVLLQIAEHGLRLAEAAGRVVREAVGAWSLRPADPVEFLTSPDYCGYGADQVPTQVEDFREMFYGPDEPEFESRLVGARKRLVFYDGALGTGKTFTAGLIAAYVCHRLLCAADAQGWLGMAGSRLDIPLLSSTREKAGTEFLHEVQKSVGRCRWFSDHGLSPGPKVSEITWPSRFLTVSSYAVNETAVAGINTPLALFDEAQAAKEEGYTKEFEATAQAVFTRLYRGAESRFEFAGLDWMIVVCSNARHENDVMAQLRERFPDGPRVMYKNRLPWESRPEIARNVLRGFPADWKDLRHKDVYWVQNTLTGNQVPITLRESMLMDLEDFSKRHEGWRPTRHSRFDSGAGVVEEQVAASTRPCPFERGSDGLASWLPEFGPGLRWGDEPGEAVPTVPICVHFDLSRTGERLGVAGVGVTGTRDYAGNRMPEYFVAFADAVEPRDAGGEIDLALIRERYVYDVRARGFEILRASADRALSDEFLQYLRKAGYDTELFSAKATPDAYYEAKAALHMVRTKDDGTVEAAPRVHGLYPLARRVRGSSAEVELFYWEWMNLVREDAGGRVKIDHAKGASNDVWDAVVGAMAKARATHEGGTHVVGGGGSSEKEPENYREAAERYEREQHRKRYWARRRG